MRSSSTSSWKGSNSSLPLGRSWKTRAVFALRVYDARGARLFHTQAKPRDGGDGSPEEAEIHQPKVKTPTQGTGSAVPWAFRGYGIARGQPVFSGRAL